MKSNELDLALPHKVADLTLAEWGRKEIGLAEREMPGLMAIRRKHGPRKPLAGLKITGSLPAAAGSSFSVPASIINTLFTTGVPVQAQLAGPIESVTFLHGWLYAIDRDPGGGRLPRLLRIHPLDGSVRLVVGLPASARALARDY